MTVNQLQPRTRRNVLVVDDNPDDARFLRDSLAQASGPEVDQRCAGDGVLALELLAGASPFADGGRPHLILVDLAMPRMGGRALICALRESIGWIDTPIFVLSGSSRSDDIADCYELGADDYVAKPWNWDGYLALAATIKRYLGHDRDRSQGLGARGLISRLRSCRQVTSSAIHTSRAVVANSRNCLRYRPRKP
jgi:CheY-like chemotaxis protein